MVHPEDAVGLVELAEGLRTGGEVVNMVEQRPEDVGGLGDELLEASLLQAGGEGVVGRLEVVQVTVGHDDCGLGLVQMCTGELLDLGAACELIDIDDVEARVGGNCFI